MLERELAYLAGTCAVALMQDDVPLAGKVVLLNSCYVSVTSNPCHCSAVSLASWCIFHHILQCCLLAGVYSAVNPLLPTYTPTVMADITENSSNRVFWARPGLTSRQRLRLIPGQPHGKTNVEGDA